MARASTSGMRTAERNGSAISGNAATVMRGKTSSAPKRRCASREMRIAAAQNNARNNPTNTTSRNSVGMCAMRRESTT